MRTRARNSSGSRSSVSWASCPVFVLVDEEAGLGMKAESGQVHRGSDEIAGKPVKPLGVVGIDGGVIMNAEA